MIYLTQLNQFQLWTQKTKNKIKQNKYLNCLVMNASNKRRINGKEGGVYSREAFIRGRRLFE